MQPSRQPRKKADDLETIARRSGRLHRMAARLPTYMADLRERPSWIAMFVLARIMLFRRLHWHRARPYRAADTPNRASLFDRVEPQQVVEQVRSQGIHVGLVLPEDICAEILDFTRRETCFGNFDRRLPLDATQYAEAEVRFGRALLSGHYFEKVLDCPAAMRVQRDPLLHEVAARYLGDRARVVSTRLWWSFPSQQASDADKNLASQDRYHFDLDDWRMIKFFFYVSGVEPDQGPHVYLRGSHKKRSLRHQFSPLVGHSADEVYADYGKDNALTLLGGPGYGFAEDPFGFHMGTVAQRAPRLMLEVGFGVSPPSRRRFHGEPVIR